MTDKTVTQAFEFDRYIDGVLMAEGVVIEKASSLTEAIAKAAKIANPSNGKVPVLVYRASQTDAQIAAPDALEDHFPTGLRSEIGVTKDTLRCYSDDVIRCECHCGKKFAGTDEQEVRQKWAAHVASLSASNAEKAIRLDERKKIIAEGCIHTRKALVARGDERNDLIAWQTEQCEWFDHVILEIVSEYAAWRDKQEPASNAMRDALAKARRELYLLSLNESTRDHEIGVLITQIDAALAGQGTTLDRQTVEQVLEPDDLLPSYCRLLDAMQGDDPDAVDSAFHASIEAVSKFGLLRASMDPNHVR